MSELTSPSLLQMQNVRKVFYRNGGLPIAVLQKIDFTVYPADRIAIVGKSGAGKSTLLHILGTLERPTKGSVQFIGQDVFSFSERQLSSFRNRQVGFVFQFHYLMLEFTALENVMMPALLAGISRRSAKEQASKLLSKVGLSARLDHKPNQLSGGEQQRVAIARALIMKPKILLTDEMTGNLDPVTGKQVIELVESIHAEFKMAIISVTHDETLASSYPKVYRLSDGILQEAHLSSH